MLIHKITQTPVGADVSAATSEKRGDPIALPVRSRKGRPCHAERSEASRCAQHDTVQHLRGMRSFYKPAHQDKINIVSWRYLDFFQESSLLDKTKLLVQMDAPAICGEHFEPDLLHLGIIHCPI